MFDTVAPSPSYSVAHVPDAVGAQFQLEQPADQVVHDKRPEVPDVRRRVHGWAAV